MANKDDKYLKEAQKVDYGVRSLFFHRDLKGRNYEEFLKKINSLKSEEYEWLDIQQLGISRKAWNRSKKNGINPLFLFCHPKVIVGDASLVAYYRGIAGIPIKAIRKICI